MKSTTGSPREISRRNQKTTRGQAKFKLSLTLSNDCSLQTLSISSVAIPEFQFNFLDIPKIIQMKQIIYTLDNEN